MCIAFTITFVGCCCYPYNLFRYLHETFHISKSHEKLHALDETDYMDKKCNQQRDRKRNALYNSIFIKYFC